MTTRQDELTDIHPSRQRVALVLAIAAAVPALVLRATAPDLPHALEAALFGLAIVGAAFILSWAAEVAQLDISAGLAIAVLALIAVLPEYAVDFVFAWQGGNSFEATGPACLPPPGGGEESPCGLALANMTGANRLVDRDRLVHGRVHRVVPDPQARRRRVRRSGGRASSSTGATPWSSRTWPPPRSTR